MNQRQNGDRVFFAANQHINPTNVCILRNTCVFCSFARMPQEDGQYTRTLEEVFAEADAARDNPTREFHIVGGLHPKLSLAYYLDMFRGLKQRHPDVQIKALTAVEVAHLARLEKISTRDVLVGHERSRRHEPAGRRRRSVQPRGARHHRRPQAHRATSGSPCTARRTSSASPRTAPCCTGTSRRWKTGWTTC